VWAAAIPALLASMLAVGCYKPNIKPNALICASGGVCPDNFKCNTLVTPALCVPSNYDAGAATGGTGTGGVAATGGAGGEGGVGGVIATGGVAGTDGGVPPPCLNPVSPCVAGMGGSAGICDPVCNTGCGKCYQKCSVDPNGDLTCNQLSPTGNPVGILGMCQQSQSSSDPSTRSDNCQPGSICLNHNACGARCYQFCRTNADCQQTGATCTIDAGGGRLACDVPPSMCDPVNGAAGTSPRYSMCPLAVQGCYLSSETGNTVCDCYNNPPGNLGASCAHSRDCYPGLVCYDPTSISGKRCYKVCRLPSPDGGADLTRVDAGETGCSDYHNCKTIQLTTSGATTTLLGYCQE
jgi:hypothetical protein